MKIIWFNVCARRRSLTWAAAATVAGLLLAVYAFLVSTSNAGIGEGRGFSAAERVDQARIREALGAMDILDDFDVAQEKMDGLIDRGLFDPENEHPLRSGEPAPDFELMPLRFYDFAIDRGITKGNAGSLFEPVRLSAFRGSLPVVLIFGSYT